MSRVFRLLERALGADTASVLALLSRGSPALLLRRLARIRRSAAAMLQASLTPPMPLRLQVETIDICNLKCRMCSREVLPDMNTRTMPLAEFTSMVGEVQPFYVTLNGLGEPLLDKTVFKKLAFLNQLAIMTSMPTNGTHLDGQRRDSLEKTMPDVLQFSIDGATRESFESIRVGGDFDAITSNYRAFARVYAEGRQRPGARARVLCALQRGNLMDFRKMYALMQSMPGISSFELVPVYNYDAAGDAFKELIPTAEDIRQVQAALDDAIATSAGDERAFYERWLATSGAWHSDQAGPAEHEPSSHACIVPWYNAYVDAKGRVFPCCYLLSEPQQVMGNLQQQSFGEIWYGERYRNMRQQMLTDRKHLPGCSTCPRNDDSRLRQFRRLAPLLGRAPKVPVPTKPARPVVWIGGSSRRKS